jgi:eukaryotic-like serine/threonine-protein kinase
MDISPDRYRRVKEICNALLDAPEEERSKLLTSECGNDKDLRSEVERLFTGIVRSKGFLDERPFAASPLAPPLPSLMIGTTVAHYQILEEIGKGGMGVVYRARDTHLDRDVALKILPPARNSDPERRRRFVQEAKSASSLNHPYIVTIHDINTTPDGVIYIAMEYVEGKTLEQLIDNTGLPVPQVVRCGARIADALSCAHAAGIVHRDLKPSNVMVNDRGHVKLMDFGLAKLTEPKTDESAGSSITLTAEGIVLGTTAYMSPEQAEGKPVDSRSDIFSFGAVLYEMLSGKRAFAGGSQASTITAILAREPAPLGEFVQNVPATLEDLTTRCLQKKPEDRPQQMDEVRAALDEMRAALESGRHVSLAPRRPMRKIAWAAVAVAILGTAGGFYFWRHKTPPVHPANAILTRLSSDAGLTAFPTLSRDGKLLAYSSDRRSEGNLDIWVQQIGGEPLRLTTDPADDTEPGFSPDGTKIVYRSERQGGGVYVVPTFGGAPHLVAKGGRDPHFSPDGTYILYWTGEDQNYTLLGSSQIYVVPVGGGTPKRIRPEFGAAHHPIWTPDGRKILFLGLRGPEDVAPQNWDWWITPLEGGAAVATGVRDLLTRHNLVAPPGEHLVVPGSWITNSDEVLFSATAGDSTNLWEVTLPASSGTASGEPHQRTSGTSLEMQPSAFADDLGKARVVFSSLARNVDVFALPLDANRGKATGEPNRLTEDIAFDGFPQLSSDGKKLSYVCFRSENADTYLLDLETGVEKALNSSRYPRRQPRISADGKLVVYWEKTFLDYAVDTESGVTEKICDQCGPPTDISPDKQKILFESLRAPDGILMVDRSSKAVSPVVLPEPNEMLFGGRVSRDGRWIVFHASRSNSQLARQIYVAPFTPQIQRKDWIPITDGTVMDREAYWSPDGNLLYWVSDRDGFRCLWAQRLDPGNKHPVGPAFAVYHLHHARRSLAGVGISPAAAGPSVAKDKIVFALSDLTGNVWMTTSAN